MDSYNMMNNSYGNIVYSGQTGEITELQGEPQPVTHQTHYIEDPNHIYQQPTEETQSTIEVLKENHFQERDSIIANNVQEQSDIDSVAYQVNSSDMEQPDATKNHDSEIEVAPENTQSDELPETAEEPTKEESNDDSKTEEVKDENPENNNEAGTEQDQPDGESSKDIKENKVADEDSKKIKVFRRDGEPADLDVCRVCTSKDNLSDIFEFESSVRICDLIMKICTAVRITQRDHLPHKICNGCVEKVRIAYEFKTTCENTDKELRKTLKRAYNKSRRTTDFVIVNCPMSDEEENDDEPQDDDEYKVSQSEVESEPVTSDDSFAPASKKKRTPRRGRGRRPKIEVTPPTSTGVKRRRGRQPAAKPSPATPAAATPRRGPGRPPKASKSPGIANVVYIEAPEASSTDSEDDKPIKQRKTHDCTKCDETFKTGVELKEHLQTHKGDLFPCTKCEKSFKSKVYLSNHLERHDQDDKKREERIKAKELKKQQQRQKELQKRQKENEERSKRPKLPASSSSAEKKKKVEPVPANSGRDLFKCVAPVTSTYWSDSFSD
ncbi:calponin homology domain-containing protein DDB_G0272472 [Topomyia yanbarensis]|uniref:calponin homology domain-containing protein DDB_G0272472 n=1 Tax=Topomyia yanbarensis TaxID=2498891 RepID=UPI00273AB16B|nr:calponin homology domain-containing protein DDB_G0272472 [Topomyia yanbarensis]